MLRLKSLSLRALFFVLRVTLQLPTSLVTGGVENGKYIIVFQDTVGNPNNQADRLSQAHGLGKGHVYSHALRGFPATVPAERLKALRTDQTVKYIAIDHVVTANAQTIPTGVSRIRATQSSIAAIDGSDRRVDVDIAIIDTGIDLNHPDLNVYRGVSFARGNADDKNGHGTHVAGTAAALDNGTGVVGVAPGARLWAVKVLGNSGSGFTSDVVAGIDYVAQHSDEIEVANMSLGGPGSDTNPNDPMHDAIQAAVAKGVVFVVAAGNESDNAANHTPAAYDEVITVSAINDSDGAGGGNGPATSEGPDDTFASGYSNYGPDVDLAAPGTSIRSTFKGGLYAVGTGTSMASPHVAGAVALYTVANGRATDAAGVAAIRNAMIASGFPQTSADGFTGDPDQQAEPLVNANIDSAPFHDLTASYLSAPTSVFVGTLITLEVGVTNNGSFTESNVLVTLSDTTAGVQLGSTVLGSLAVGQTVNIPFSADSNGATLGNHLLEASVATVPGELLLSNNTTTATITLLDPNAPQSTLHVGNIVMGFETKGKGHNATATIFVLDQEREPGSRRYSGRSMEWSGKPIGFGSDRCRGFRNRQIGSLQNRRNVYDHRH